MLNGLTSLISCMERSLESKSALLVLPPMPVHLLFSNNHQLVPDGIYSGSVLCAPKDNMASVMLQQCNSVTQKLIQIAYQQMKKHGLATDVLDQFLRRFDAEEYVVKSTWPGHTWFTFSPWNSLIDTIKLKYIHGLPATNMLSVEDLQFTDTYPTLSESWKNPNDTKRFEHALLIGNHKSTCSVIENDNVSHYNVVDFSDDWMPALLEKAYSLPSNTLFVFFLDLTMFVESSELQLCCNNCENKIRNLAIPSNIINDDFKLNNMFSSKMKLILGELLLLRKCIPIQSTISLAPVPPQRVLLIESEQSISQADHNNLHEMKLHGHKTLESIGITRVFMGTKVNWKRAFLLYLKEQTKPTGNLIVNFNSREFSCNAALECVHEPSMLSSAFPALEQWNTAFTKLIGTHLSSTFPPTAGALLTTVQLFIT